MAAVPEPLPDLTGSKSSKSSSFHSSLDHDAGFTDNSHFEDIGLEDEHPYDQDLILSRSPGFDKFVGSKGYLPHVGHRGARHDAASLALTRELTTAKRPTYTTFQRQDNGIRTDHSHLGLPSVKRGFDSPSTPVLAMNMACRGRSPSPPGPRSLPPRNSLRTASGASPTLKPVTRRSSWQPSRKSVQQLEEEYDDRDEEVPDDAVFWNVPISPRPLQDRAPRPSCVTESSSTSPERRSPLSVMQSNDVLSPTTLPANSSFSHPNGFVTTMSPHSLQHRVSQSDCATNSSSISPERKSPLHITQQNDVLSPTKPPANTPFSHRKASAPTSPVKPTLPRGASTGSFPIDRSKTHLQNMRSTSWTVALSELSEETKTLTEALEAYADNEGRQHEKESRKNQPNLNLNHPKLRTQSTTVELPPLMKPNVMIDPLPISKEKEAVLSRTRPSWLPPKSQREEKKHLKQYQAMMAMSLEAERKKAERDNQTLRCRDESRTSIHRIWDQHVLPDWARVIREPRTRELWWRGVPSRSRGVVWQRAIGNNLELTEVSYRAALKRAKNLDNDIRRHGGGALESSRQRHADGFAAIQHDAAETFPELRIFQSKGPLHEALVDVLMAYAMYRSDVGYIYGVNLVAALLLLNLSTTSTFITLSNLLNRPLPLAFLTSDPGAVSRTYSLTLRALAYKMPHLHNHLTNTLSIPSESYLEPVFRTLFASHLSVDIVSRVWDAYVFEGDALLVRTAVALLGRLEPRLYGSEGEVLGVLGWEAVGPWDVGSEDDFMSAVRSAGKEEWGRNETLVV
ncbi:MAG: hypothetical protein M1833_006402 [Piccolia ochrophora]|nr:MAG: hypothetical protein M1833_006402 [Piccolia ochrophora]